LAYQFLLLNKIKIPGAATLFWYFIFSNIQILFFVKQDDFGNFQRRENERQRIRSNFLCENFFSHFLCDTSQRLDKKGI